MQGMNRSGDKWIDLLLRFLSVDVVEEGEEDEAGATEGSEGDGVAEEHRADDHADHLPGRHDDGEHDGPEGLDRVEDEHLPRRRGDRGDYVVPDRRRVRPHELDHGRQLILEHQSGDGDDDGAAVHAEHHLVGRRLVVFVDPVLPLGRERVAADVEDEARQAVKVRVARVAASDGRRSWPQRGRRSLN